MRIILWTLMVAVVLLSYARADEFERAATWRPLEFPRDHASHPEYRTEWWYFTGVLEADDGRTFGFQATWFRTGLERNGAERRSRLATRDLMFFHGAITDVSSKSFAHESVASRAASSWAGAATEDLRVHVFDRTLARRPDGSWEVAFTVEGRRVELVLTAQRPPLLHGVEPGLSQKGPVRGQASYYYSFPRMRAEGTLELEPGGSRVAVRGRSWFDQEFGSNQLADDQIGWDWFSVALSDGSDLMLYVIRRDDGTIEPASSGTLRRPDGSRAHLPLEAFTIEVLERWRSAASGATYPSRWRIRIPDHAIDLTVTPLVADQELRTQGTTGVTYWEGLSQFRGDANGVAVTGRGYIELVGYAGRFRGI